MARCAGPSGASVAPRAIDRRDHRGPGVVDLHAGEGLRGALVDPAVFADDRDLGQPVAAADLEVRGIVPGSYLQRPGAEFRVNVIVGDDRQPATY